MPNAHGVGVYLCNPRPPMRRPPDCERKRKRLLGSQRCPSIGLKVLLVCQDLIKFERRTLHAFSSKSRSVGYDIPDGESGESIKDFPFHCFQLKPRYQPSSCQTVDPVEFEQNFRNYSQQYFSTASDSADMDIIR